MSGKPAANLRHVGKSQSGQALTEFAICAPVFCLFFFGILQVLLLFQAWFFSYYAARCAARSYCVYFTQNPVLAEENALLAARQAVSMCRPRPTVQVFQDPLSAASALHAFSATGHPFVNIRVVVEYPLIFPWVGRIFPVSALADGDFPITCSVAVPLEGPSGDGS